MVIFLYALTTRLSYDLLVCITKEIILLCEAFEVIRAIQNRQHRALLDGREGKESIEQDNAWLRNQVDLYQSTL